MSRIRDEVTRALSGHIKTARIPPLWDGHAADRIARNVLGQEFQRDTPTKFEVLSLVDYAHASRADLAENAVMRVRLANELRRCGHF